MKKFLLISIFGVIGFYGLGFAFNEFSYENAKTLANEYIRNSSVDENWKDKNPHLSGEGKYFYTDSDSPSYVEFKVSCDNNPSCGFIMVNFDGDDVSIPIASTSGNTPSEVMLAKNGDTDSSNSKLYYFNPFEQYAENEVSGNVSSIDPQDDFSDSSSGSLKANSLSKSQEKTKKNKLLKDKVLKAKDEAKKFKKTDEFKKLKKELKDKKQTNGKDDKVSFKYLDMAMADLSNGSKNIYTPPIASNVFIKGQGISSIDCTGLVPCYQQFEYTTYNNLPCMSGCSPTAIGIVLGYYDRNGKGNLITGIAGIKNDFIINSLIGTIRGYIGTTCSIKVQVDTNKWVYESSTNPENRGKIIDYIKKQGYKNSETKYSTGSSDYLFGIIKYEIDNGRPIIVGTKNHALVTYGYNKNNIIRINLGWGVFPFYNKNGTVIYTSEVDYNINSIFYNNQYQGGIINTTSFNIK